jgi:hypothetical protein
MNLMAIRASTLFLLNFLIILTASAQVRIVRGVVKDTHSDELIPFASVQFSKSTFGKLTDSAGKFTITLNKWPSDTLIISYAGFEDKIIFIDTSLFEIDLAVAMERGRPVGEVVIKGKINRGLMLWKKIVRNKPNNNRARFNNYSYELYNKLEIDINKVNKEQLQKGFLPPKPFKFILNNIDTASEENPILPIYLTETISDYYYQSDPKRTKEVIKGNKTIGIKNESFSRLLGGMYQNINVYNNFIPVFDLEFISPISDNGDNYYTYKVPDTQFVAGKRYFHFVFYPKRKGENTFQGDAWIADSSFAVQKMNLRLSPTANVNFVEKLSMVQEYQLVSDSIWFLSKDKFIVDFSLIGKKSINFIGRKTTTYKDVAINSPQVEKAMEGEQLREAIVMTKGATGQTDEYWKENRHEELNTNEQKIYATVDTLLKMPEFHKLKERLYFLGSGYKNIGNLEIGPWFNWISGNIYEGFRVRFDLGTNTKFSKKLYLHGYLAYGFEDKGIKGMAEAKYMFSRNPRSYLHVIFKDDIDYGQTYYDEIGYDNIFALAIRKSQVPIKLIRIKEQEINYLKEWKSGFSIKSTLHRQTYNPLINLPTKDNYTSESGEIFNTFEASVKFRFAYLEKYLETSFSRVTMGSDLPIIEARITKAFAGVLNSSYDYTKVGFNVSDFADIPPIGNIYWSVFAGKTFGVAPYMFLNIAPGNEIYYYNKYAFNLMNRYEYINDRYAGLIFEHNIGSGIFKLVQPLRFLKFRQFWNVKMLMGGLSDENKALNFTNGHPFSTLEGKPYMEVGTGIDNILKFFRLDLVWRLMPTPLPQEQYRKFGVFGSFRVGF